MTTVTIDEKKQVGRKLEKYPPASFIEDDGPLPYPEEELISLKEFDEFLCQSAYERFGIKLDLSPENLATFE
jgi:hypothetical protein